MSKTYVSASLKRLVFERAQSTCEYRLISTTLALASHQIDHIIAEKHGGNTVSENLESRVFSMLLRVSMI